jgi:hypothetical protein
MTTLNGDIVIKASEITTKSVIVEVRLYLLGLLKVVMYGKSKKEAALQILLIEPSAIVGF